MKILIIALMISIPIFCHAQWNAVNTNTDVSINAVHFFDSLQGYFVGGGDENDNVNEDDGVIFRTSDGGENWVSVYTQDSLVLNYVVSRDTLLAKLLESATPNISKNGNSTIFQKFIDLLSKENELTNKVNHYASLLNTTPQNLNAICRKETGQSSAEIISEHIINEAKRLLLYTDFTVSEIAHKLHFKDNSHFSKYFKRHVEQTPIGFRNDNN